METTLESKVGINKNTVRNGLISNLENIQAKYGYLPQKELFDLSKATNQSLTDIYGAATFYKAFNLKPTGKHRISSCLGTACHVRNAPSILEEFENKLNIKVGNTTKDREFSLESVNCLGACALGPIAVIDGHYFSKVTKNKVSTILDEARKGFNHIEVTTDQRIFPVELSCSRCNHSLMDMEHLIDEYPGIHVTVSYKDNHGWFLMSALYGSYNVSSQFELPPDAVVQIFCPHCHSSLIGASECPECGIKMVPMIIRGGGIAQICPRKGCKGHILDINGTFVY
ncbi:MAG: hypothetical protein HW421_450 [Ignavibacteria bacterium]|nr:hypothetical protein [Ignavibacteria bacterium]